MPGKLHQTIHFHDSTWFICKSVLEETTQRLWWSLARQTWPVFPPFPMKTESFKGILLKSLAEPKDKAAHHSVLGALSEENAKRSGAFTYQTLQKSHSPCAPPPTIHTLVSLFLYAFREFSSQDPTWLRAHRGKWWSSVSRDIQLIV